MWHRNNFKLPKIESFELFFFNLGVIYSVPISICKGFVYNHTLGHNVLNEGFTTYLLTDCLCLSLCGS